VGSGLRAAEPASQPRSGAPRNVVLVLVDGLRWSEVFAGADEALLTKEAGVANVEAARREYWRPTPEERRSALMPFVWSTMAREGQLWGNQAKGGIVRVSNEFWFSYPGYSEMAVGYADPRVNSNDPNPNPNVSVFEWLHQRPGFGGRVAAFGGWDTVAAILNRQRCGFYVNTAFEPITNESGNPKIKLINQLRKDIPSPWECMPYDGLTFHGALEYLKERRPRALYIALGETDEWGHAGKYADYLKAARMTDGFLRLLWQTLQSIPAYTGRSTLIVAADHGRGKTPADWKDHGAKVPGSQDVWVLAIGPGIAPQGERTGGDPATLAQVAATVAAAVGEDFTTFDPKVHKPLGLWER
jgi:hypothetical protein